MKRFLLLITTLMFSLLARSHSAFAMDAFEYQVYDGEINKMGAYTLETHLNSNIKGKSTPDFDGKLDENHLNHLTFEFARGMSSFWELGSYLQSALSEDGIYRYAGAKLRSKFVLPRKESDPLQLGINFEVSNVPHAFEQDRWGSEIRPILGYTIHRFKLLLNPIIDVNLTSGKSATPDFSPAFKALFDTKCGFGIGAEYYSDFGEVNRLLSRKQAEQYLFAAYDLLNSIYELNVAVGAGLSSASNPIVAKGIFGFTF